MLNDQNHLRLYNGILKNESFLLRKLVTEQRNRIQELEKLCYLFFILGMLSGIFICTVVL